ncbi:MAG: Uma2 family endonuclease [Planctomycetota bacterium]|nr:MAG: Uma2 family endonuclease [Planctomycetota bacterium]
MSTARNRITPQEYVIRERQAPIKSEFYQGEIFAMGGGSANHSLIAANFVGEARNSLKGRPCAVFNSDLRVQVQSTGLYTYPDATIVCGELLFDDDHRDTLLNPTLIVEVLSDSTEKYDRGKKSNHYRQIASLKELILIAQDRSHVERFTRQANGDWLFHEQKELTADFELKSLGISIAISELYRGVKFEPIEDDVNASR